MDEYEIALRCYAIPTKQQWKPPLYNEYESIPDRVLIFDTETTIDQNQNLTFGYFEIYYRGKLEYSGLFYNPSIKKSVLKILRHFSRENGIDLMKSNFFVDNVLLPEIYDLKTLCIGFNLPFDLSRLCISFGNARGKDEGGFSLKLSRNYPRLIIKQLDSKRAFIKFGGGFSSKRGNARNKKGKPKRFRGNFLDLRTLAFALTNNSHSLESACEFFRAEIGKTHPVEHGKISREYIEYNINDVKATYSLYVKYQPLKGLASQAWLATAPLDTPT